MIKLKSYVQKLRLQFIAIQTGICLCLLGLSPLLHATATKTISATVAIISTIPIPEHHYGIDTAKKLIVVNKNVSTLNTNYPELKTQLTLDATYTFANPVATLVIGTPYTVRNSSNVSYTLYFTELPLVFINTPNTIVDTPGVWASFSLMEQDGTLVNSDIEIEIRGASSQSYPKKSFEIEFNTDNTLTESQNFSLVGMRSDDDYILQAIYNEPIRVNSKVSFDFWRQIHTLYYQADEPEAITGIHFEYTELFVNNEYRGVYALGEKSDRKQLKLKKFKDGAIRGELYKGDYNDKWGYIRAVANSYDNTDLVWNNWKIKYPDENVDWANLSDFFNFVVNEPDASFHSGIGARFQMDNAVDYFIFLNLIRGRDNRANNLYIAKYSTDEPYFYTPWDLDMTFGFRSFVRENVTDDLMTNGLYDRLLLDTRVGGFRDQLFARWAALRANGVVNHTNIMNLFNTNVNYLTENAVFDREHIAWPTYTFDPSDVQYVATWLNNRIAYLDTQFTAANRCKTVISVAQVTIENGWAYYAINTATNPLFAIEVLPSGTGVNTNNIINPRSTIEIVSTKDCSAPTFLKTSGTNSILAKGEYWNVKLLNSLNGWVNIRWFSNAVLEQALVTEAQATQSNTGAAYLSPKLHLKTKTQPLDLPNDFQVTAEGAGLTTAYEPLLNSTTGSYNGHNYIQYNQVSNLNNTGGGLFMTTTNENESLSAAELAALKGSIRYNNTTHKFQGFNGTQWVNFN